MSTHDDSIKNQKNQSLDLLQNLICSLSEKRRRKVDSVLHIHDQLFSHLRSKIIPEKQIHNFTEHLFHTYLSHDKKIDIYCLLASPTALKEMYHFLEFIQLFGTNSNQISPHFILVEWIDFHNNLALEHERFRNTTRTLLNYLCTNLNEYHLMTFSLHQCEFLNPFIDNFFMREFQCIMNALSMEKGQYAEKSNLDIDAEWIKNFYARQYSLNSLNPMQAIFDLAVRRTIGAYISKINNESEGCNVLVTSELNKRFLKCYRTEATICNINVS